jgi:hypothetical protein
LVRHWILMEADDGPTIYAPRVITGKVTVVTVNEVEEVAFPAGVTTLNGPLVAPAGTVQVISPELTTVKTIFVPLSLTAVAPLKSEPVMVITVPTGPLVGLKEVMVGASTVTVKDAEEVAVPPAVVTLMVPVVAETGTTVVICVALTTVKVVVTPLKRTAVAPVKFVPVNVTDVPAGPLVGLKEVMVGAGTVTVNDVEEVAVPLGVVTLIAPVVAAAGTVQVICVELTTVKDAAVPLKRTAVAPVKFVPVNVTAVPAGPLVGLKEVMAGAGKEAVTVKAAEETAVPADVETLIVPVVAAGGTVQDIWVELTTVYVADAPLKLTLVAPEKPEPVSVTTVPEGPEVGEKEVMEGKELTTVKTGPVPVP